MSLEFKVGDPVWVNGKLKGEIIKADFTDPTLPYFVHYDDDAYSWFHPRRLMARSIEQTIAPQPDSIESAVSAMATSCTAQPRPRLETSIAKQQLKAVLYLLQAVEADDHKLLGDHFARVAITAALPLLQSVFDELD